MITSKEITDEQIRYLRAAAQRAGDDRIVDTCTIALWDLPIDAFVPKEAKIRREVGLRKREIARDVVADWLNIAANATVPEYAALEAQATHTLALLNAAVREVNPRNLDGVNDRIMARLKLAEICRIQLHRVME